MLGRRSRTTRLVWSAPLAVVAVATRATRAPRAPRATGATLAVLLTVAMAATVAARPAHAAGGAPAVRDLNALERAVNELESLVAGARFEDAIEAASSMRRWADDVPRGPESQKARARIEVLACTAQVALGDETGARRSMERAIYVWPLLSLDERNASPRIVGIFRKLRGGGPAAGRSQGQSR